MPRELEEVNYDLMSAQAIFADSKIASLSSFSTTGILKYARLVSVDEASS